MPPSTADAYMIGKLGSYDVPTIAKVDAAIRELTAAIPAASQGRRRRIWADIDQLLERRLGMVLEEAL